MILIEKYLSKEQILQIQMCNDLCQKAYLLISIIFIDKADKSGQPYIGHLVRVANILKTDEEKCAGLLHDVIEDTEISENDLFILGFPRHIIVAVCIDTRNKKIEYDTYINQIISSGNQIALRVKRADLLDNTNPDRIELLPKEIQNKLTKKYQGVLEKIEGAIV